MLPAVDKAVELGIADPKRLGVMGQSFGGFSTMGLITQTNRFQAAVALAGLSNLVSLYGQFDPRTRYDDYPHENLFYMFLAESGQENLGNTLSQNFARYLRNSPIFYAERVQTPLMIIQGDMDYVTMSQGEEFFMALHRQGKRAALRALLGRGTRPGGPREHPRHVAADLRLVRRAPEEAGRGCGEGVQKVIGAGRLDAVRPLSRPARSGSSRLFLRGAGAAAQSKPEAASVIEVGEDRPLSLAGQNAPLVEPHLAVNPSNPKHLLAGVIVVTKPDMTATDCAPSLSFDGGATWGATTSA